MMTVKKSNRDRITKSSGNEKDMKDEGFVYGDA
jgi:hypothetical protein